ncbi:MAG TPA: DNA mismatch repair protein MutT, partial [Phenylobacterium sp.]
IGYLALGLSPARELHPADDTEALEVLRVPFREAFDAAMAGDLQDVLTVAMLLKAHHMARDGSLPPALARAMIG